MQHTIAQKQQSLIHLQSQSSGRNLTPIVETVLQYNDPYNGADSGSDSYDDYNLGSNRNKEDNKSSSSNSYNSYKEEVQFQQEMHWRK